MEFENENQDAKIDDLMSPKFDMQDEIEVNSAFGAEEMLKMRMY